MSALTKRREKTQQDTFIVGLVRKPWLCAQKKKKLRQETKYERNL